MEKHTLHARPVNAGSRGRHLPLAAALLAMATSAPSWADDKYFKVTITNLTKAQTFTPTLVTSHQPGVTLFTAGDLTQPAGDALEALAEGGETTMLADLLAMGPRVNDIAVAEAVPPGESRMVMVANGEDYRYLSLAAMLVPTNDAFVALNNVTGPKEDGELAVFYPLAYDAGTEPNSELCDDIPGGGVCGGLGGEGTNLSEDGEGFVHVHAGIHEVGDLASSVYDWRNPVARVTVEVIEIDD